MHVFGEKYKKLIKRPPLNVENPRAQVLPGQKCPADCEETEGACVPKVLGHSANGDG